MPDLDLEHDLEHVARQALLDWDLAVTDVREVSRSENIVFRVTTGDGRFYVLRLHRPGYHSFEELVSEQIWTSALDAEGLDVPVPLLTRTSAPYGSVRMQDEDRFTGVLGWVDGQTMAVLMQESQDATFARLRFRQLGELLARLHNQACGWSPPAGFQRQVLDEHGLAGEQPFWGRFWEADCLTGQQKAHFSELRRTVFEVLSKLPKDASRFSMTHADLHPDNVVMHGERLHVIDFDDAGFGWHAYDLAVALKDYQDHPEFEQFRAALIAGYRSTRPLDDATIRLIPLFLLIRALASIGWSDARPELENPEYAARLVDYVEDKAETVLAPFG